MAGRGHRLSGVWDVAAGYGLCMGWACCGSQAMSCKCERLCVVCKPLCDMRILLLCLAGVRILCRVCIFLAMWHLRVPSIYLRMGVFWMVCLQSVFCTSCRGDWVVGCCVLGMGCRVLGGKCSCRL